MSATRPNLTRPPLTLDEQSFQGLLSAAFTIQEHNDRRKKSKEESESEAKVETTCPHCGARKLDEASRCASCGRDEFRPGERLQRNWASMWLKSQEQGLWPALPSEANEAARNTGGGPQEDLPPVQLKQPFEAHPEHARAASNARAEDNLAGSEPFEFANEEDGPTAAPVELAGDDTSYSLETAEESDTNNHGGPSSVIQRLAELEVTLRFHRADLYLGMAVFVALIALLWPVARAPRQATLGPLERALVGMGIAEAPAPVVHLQGDPSINVWVDPHTALYYCPGSEPYGKTADGHFSSQHEAQMDAFEPAGRSVCE